MNIIGEYTIKTKKKILVEKHNLITNIGESFFLNRWINNEFSPINTILFGKGTLKPTKKDNSMSIPYLSKNIRTNVDLNNRKINMTLTCSASEIVGTSEIGVTNEEGILISHDTYDTITSEMLADDHTSNVDIEYSFTLTTGHIRDNWTPSIEGENIFYVYEPNTVIGVVDYTGKTSLNELEPNCYYYDNNSSNLYIKTNGKIPNYVIVNTK